MLGPARVWLDFHVKAATSGLAMTWGWYLAPFFLFPRSSVGMPGGRSASGLSTGREVPHLLLRWSVEARNGCVRTREAGACMWPERQC